VTRYIQRHSLLKRVIHGFHAVAFLTLIVTGAIVFVPAIGVAFGSQAVQVVRFLHRVFAVVFIVAPLVGIAVAPQGFAHLMKNLTSRWDADDKEFMRLFPKYLFAPKTTKMPKQHEVKSGQRLADGAVILTALLIAASGVVLWTKGFGSADAFWVALLVHDAAFILLLVVVPAHIYLGSGLFQPYRGLARLMFGDGRVSEEAALYHWGHWAEDELASGKNVVEE